jgi:DNA-directed RNA polymerase specialized sigma24 family protein
MAEVADILNLTAENAKVKLHRTRKKMVLLLNNEQQ